MCLGNHAEGTAHYINAQLAALYENAVRCSEMHGTGHKPTKSENEYATCLFEFYGQGKQNRNQPSKQDLLFYATFDVPHIEFVCNHEAVLYLNIKEGHYTYDKTKPGKNVNKKRTERNQENMSNYSIAFRLDFSSHSITNYKCPGIGDSQYGINLLVLDYNSASFNEEYSSFPTDSPIADERNSFTKERRLQALTSLLTKQYLPLLKRAGYHVLYSLPDFHNLTSTPIRNDYSVVNKRMLFTHEVYGVDIDELNRYLQELWFEAAGYVDEQGALHEARSDMLQQYLVEHRSIWIDSGEDMHFHMYFGPPQIKALCKCEVVLYIDLQEVHVHIGTGFSEQPQYKVSNWEVAIVVDSIVEEDIETHVKRIKLDLSTARFCEHLSTMMAEDMDAEFLTRLRTTLVRYITRYYLTLIETAKHHYIYDSTKRVIEIDEEEGNDGSGDEEEYGCDCEDESTCGHAMTNKDHIRWRVTEKKRITHTNVFGFDQVTALSQGSINSHFKSVWELARQKVVSSGSHLRTWSSQELEIQTCLAEYSYVHHEFGDEIFFNATFGAPQISLVCAEGSRSVVLYIQLQDGFLKTLGRNKSLVKGGEEYPFSGWRLAFTIDLEFQDCTENDVSDAILNILGNQKPSSFKQLVLDFSSAKFSQARSNVPGLQEGRDFRLIRSKREAIIHYLTHFYFPVLDRGGHHVLYTLPIWDTETLPQHALTSVNFQIYPFIFGSNETFVDGLFGRQRIVCERNMIVFLGMTNRRPAPGDRFPHSANWICGIGKEIPLGAVCISRQTFLEGHLLSMFAHINRHTTIIPTFSGVSDDDEWTLNLSSWGQQGIWPNRKHYWKETTKPNSNTLNFGWRYRDEWRYEREGDSDTAANGHYVVRCVTHNTLSIPTTHNRGSCAITVGGNVKLELSSVGPDKDWTAEMSAEWKAVIILTSEAGQGLNVYMSSGPSKVIPKFQKARHEGAMGHSTVVSAFAQLEERLSSCIDFRQTLEQLKASFEGVESHLHMNSKHFNVTNPSFNRRGDLLLDLQVRETEQRTAKGHQPSKSSSAVTANGSASEPVRQKDARVMSSKPTSARRAPGNGYDSSESETDGRLSSSEAGKSQKPTSQKVGTQKAGAKKDNVQKAPPVPKPPSEAKWDEEHSASSGLDSEEEGRSKHFGK